MKKIIKLFDPSIDSEEEKIVLQVLKSHNWASGSGMGHVLQFEEKFRKYIGSNTCIAVNSGTSALNLALSLADIKNKEVILPSLTFVSTAHSIIINGGKPIFADIDPSTLCINSENIEKLINKNTRVILPVHFGGMPSNLGALRKICKKNELLLIEDAAHAVGSTYNNKHIGSHGDFCCFSFHPVKNLAMPTGGLISINQKNYKKLKTTLYARRWCGITKRKDSVYDVEELGWNYYMNEFSAALGLVQLKKLDNLNSKRKRIAKIYSKEINLKGKMSFSNDCSYHLYWILVKNQKKFRQKMYELGIETGIHYRPIHTMSMYKNNTHLPITEKIGQHIVTIPIHANLSDDDISKIIYNVNKFA